MSAATIQLPSACFFQISTYLPLTGTWLPAESILVPSEFPIAYPMSPERATSIFVGYHLTETLGEPSPNASEASRIAFLPIAIGLLGGKKMASSK